MTGDDPRYMVMAYGLLSDDYIEFIVTDFPVKEIPDNELHDGVLYVEVSAYGDDTDDAIVKVGAISGEIAVRRCRLVLDALREEALHL